MPDGEGATLLEDLPEEIIDNILVRLPSKDVGCCRAISASWRSATSTPEFMLRHHRRQPSLPIGRATLVIIGAAGASIQQKLGPFLPGAKHRHEIRLRCACDGLLAVSWRSRFYVCNPVTRKRALLPQPQPCDDQMGFGKDIENSIVGFYRHHSTGEHRVLWVSRHLHEHYSLYVLTVGCDRPRHVEVPSPKMKHILLGVLYVSSNLPVAHRGNLHWHPYVAVHVTCVDGQITVFDGEAELFRWMRCPAQVSQNISVNGVFACSGMPHHDFMAIHVWVTQNYEAEIWSFSYRIDVSQLEASTRLCLTSFRNEKGTPIDLTVKYFYHMAMLSERELLIRVNGAHLLRCDADDKFLGMVNISGSECPSISTWLTQDRLQESIIPIPCNEMQEEEDEEDPFS